MNETFEQKDFLSKQNLRFQKYGVKIAVEAEKTSYLNEIYVGLKKVFPKGLEPLDRADVEYQFFVRHVEQDMLEFYLADEKLFEQTDEKLFFNMVESRIRVTIAEFAVGKVFLHAGVVGWKGQAIIIPATSFSGKTTLVAELVKKGAIYYSDEYAVIDTDGNVEPFPKWLSMRGIIDDTTQIDCAVESIGGVAADKSIPPGLILLAKYKKGRKIPKKWQPKQLTQGTGIMEILPHTIPIRNNPKFVLGVLNKLTKRAIIVRTVRGEAAEFAEPLLGYFESRAK